MSLAGLKPFFIQHCLLTFTSTRNLNRHIETHQETKENGGDEQIEGEKKEKLREESIREKVCTGREGVNIFFPL